MAFTQSAAVPVNELTRTCFWRMDYRGRLVWRIVASASCVHVADNDSNDCEDPSCIPCPVDVDGDGKDQVTGLAQDIENALEPVYVASFGL